MGLESGNHINNVCNCSLGIMIHNWDLTLEFHYFFFVILVTQKLGILKMERHSGMIKLALDFATLTPSQNF